MRQFMDRVFGDRRARLITLVALAGLAAALLLLPTSSASEAATNHLAGYIALGLFVVAAVLVAILEVRLWPYTSAVLRATRAANAALRSGRAMPLPPLPRNLSRSQRERQPDVEAYTREIISVPWGERVTISGPGLRPRFDEAVTTTRRIAGDWSRLREPVRAFAAMDAPWCYIGAAEVLLRLSFLVGRAFSPVGLMQGLRYIAQAQAVDPDNADALITRAQLLSAIYHPRWKQLAQETLARAQAIAPAHFRLPFAEAAFFNRYGTREQALACLEQAVGRAPTPTDLVIARAGVANTYLAMGRWDDAVAAYRALLQTESSDPWLWHNLSIALYELQRYEEALECNQRALSIMSFGAAFSFGATIRKKLAASVPGGYAGGNPAGYPGGRA